MRHPPSAAALRENRRVTPDAEREHPTAVFHYSDDGSIERFVPKVAPSNPSHPRAVWALDEAHAPLYWFPRRCPRISVWADDDVQQERLSELFHTEASRVCAAETSWIAEIRAARLYEYRFDGADFAPWAEESGQYVSGEIVRPVHVEQIDDLMGRHAAHEVELRFTPRLGALMDAMLASQLPFGFVRIRDARR